MHNLRAAIIGLGFVGRAHLEALRRQGIHVAGILGSSPERSEEARATLGLDRAYRCPSLVQIFESRWFYNFPVNFSASQLLSGA